MTSYLFNYPGQAFYGRVFAKSKIYAHSKPSNAIKQKIIEQIDKIIWQYKLSSENVNLPINHNIAEIQVFDILLKSSELSDAVLECIDNAVPFPIFYQIIYKDKIRFVASYKKYNVSKRQWRVSEYFKSPWAKLDNDVKECLPISLSLTELYEQMLRRYMPIPAREGEKISDQVKRIKQINFIKNKYKKTEFQISREKQFNRKMILNAQLRVMKEDLDLLLN